MAEYKNIQASLLRFCSDTALQQELLTGTKFAAKNLDAYAETSSLTDPAVIGIENLAMQSATDNTPTASLSCSVTVGTTNDTNNMLLTQVVGSVYELLKPESEMVLYDAEAEASVRLGIIKVMGRTQILPVQHAEGERVFQSVLFQAAAIA